MPLQNANEQYSSFHTACCPAASLQAHPAWARRCRQQGDRQARVKCIAGSTIPSPAPGGSAPGGAAGTAGDCSNRRCRSPLHSCRRGLPGEAMVRAVGALPGRRLLGWGPCCSDPECPRASSVLLLLLLLGAAGAACSQLPLPLPLHSWRMTAAQPADAAGEAMVRAVGALPGRHLLGWGPCCSDPECPKACCCRCCCCCCCRCCCRCCCCCWISLDAREFTHEQLIRLSVSGDCGAEQQQVWGLPELQRSAGKNRRGRGRGASAALSGPLMMKGGRGGPRPQAAPTDGSRRWHGVGGVQQ